MAKHKKRPMGGKAVRLRSTAASSALDSSRSPLNHGGTGEAQNLNIKCTFPNPSSSGTSMQQLALNTRNKSSHWDVNSSLRGRPITFISAGFVEPLTEGDTKANPTTSAPATESTHLGEVDVGGQGRLLGGTGPLPQIPPTSIANDPTSTVSQNTADDDSDSSNEVILFKGRHALINSLPGFDVKDRAEKALAKTHGNQTTPSSSHSTTPQRGDFDTPLSDTDSENESDAAINDYVENMSAEDIADIVQQLTQNRRDLGGSDDDIVINIGGGGSNNGDGNHGHGNDNSGAIPHNTMRSRSKSAQQPARGATDGSGAIVELDDGWQLEVDSDDGQITSLEQGGLGMSRDDFIPLESDDETAMIRRARHHQPNKQNRRSKGALSWNHTVLTSYGLTGTHRSFNGAYPSAEAVANAFEQLEVTGWSHNQGDLELELSDMELENKLKASWQKDRQRKKERKRAREELRAKGLLGKKSDPNDPRLKYPNGMSLDDMQEEFRSFLLGSQQSITLAPMDAHARKVVHEIAYRFNIASKSTGSGEQRRPTLARTKATTKFNDEQFQLVFANYRRRFFARLDNRANKAGSKKIGARKGGDPGAATVKNGEVVGGSAPEIGLANKGRTMLEKMGWSTGMALGATDNKGMTQIIEHIVKRSKAGLG